MRKILPLVILCLSFATSWGQTSNGTCLTAEPMYTGDVLSYQAGVGTGTAQVGPDYGCLLTQPNPAWYYFEIENSGNLDLELSNTNNEDIDFILWGPFTDEVTPCTALLSAGNTEDCSYSTTSNEAVNVVGAISGEFYIMMVTNFSNNATSITITEEASSTATTNASITCGNVDWGVGNSGTIEAPSDTVACSDGVISLLANGKENRRPITPGLVIQVFPNNAISTNTIEFFEDGASLGSISPGANENFSQKVTSLDPNDSHSIILTNSTAGANSTYEIYNIHSGTLLSSGTWNGNVGSQTISIPPSTLTGTAAFSISPPAGTAGLTSYNWGGGVFDPSSVPPGSYDITYSWNDDNSFCSGTETKTIVVKNPYSVTGLAYTGDLCTSNTGTISPSVGFTASTGGTFSATPTGLDIDPSTGVISPSSSDAGAYTIEYFVGTALPSVCNASQTTSVTILGSPAPSITGAADYCASDANVSVSANQAYTTYSWSTGGSAMTEAIDEADGAVTLTVTDANGCSATTSSVTVSENADPTPSITGAADYCANDASVTVSADQAYTTYSWSSGGAAMTESIDEADGAVTLTVTDANGCSATTSSVTVSENADPTPSITGVADYCASDANVTVSADQAYTTYSWSTGGSAMTEAIDEADGAVTLTVTDANGCSATTSSVTVSENADPTPSITGAADYCASDANVTVSADQAYTTYSWSTGGSAMTEAIDEADGSVTLTVTDGNGCSGTSGPVTVSENADPTPSITGAADYCASDANVTVSADQAYTTYSWSSGGSAMTEAIDEADGSVSLTVTDANGCSATTSSVTVSENADPTPSITGAADYCASDASVTVSADQAYTTYSWSTGGSAMTEAIDEADGSVSLTVTDGNGCSGTSGSVSVSENADPTPSITGAADYCASDASVTVSADQAYTTYSWSTGGSAMTEDIDQADGSVSLTVTDGNGCSGTSSAVTVSENADPTPSITGAADYCASDASVTVSADQAYTTYSWSTGGSAMTEDIDQADGSVTLTVTDGNGCSGTSIALTVSENADPTPSITGAADYCESDASVTVSADQAYTTYSWSSGGSAMTEAIDEADGSVTLTVTDGNGCSGTSGPVTVSENADPTPSITGAADYCASDANVTVSADQAYTTYSWSSGGSAMTEAIDQADGSVSLTVTDGNGCSATTSSVTVSENADPTPSITGAADYCASDANVTVSADQAYTTYSWSTGGSAMTENIDQADGSVSLTVTDGNGCSGTSGSVTVSENADPTPSITGAADYCASDANVSVSADQAYTTYSWSTGGSAMTEAIDEADGSVSLTVTDANGCSATTSSVTVSENADPTPSITGAADYCASDASVTVSADQTYTTYSWSTGGSAMTENIDQADGSVSLTVTDANGCSATTSSVTVSENADPTPSITGAADYCASDANVTVSADQAYTTYSWSTGGSAMTEAIDQADGSVSLTVTDGNGCSGTSGSVTVSENADPTPSITGAADYCASDASVTVSADQAYTTYSWSTGGSAMTEAIDEADGSVSLTVTDANGCSATTSSVTVSENADPTPSITGAADYCASDANVTVSADQAYTTYSWSSGGSAMTEAIDEADGAVTLTVTDGNGCSGTSGAVTVSENADPTPSITGAADYCASDASVTVSANQAYTTYSWSTGGSAMTEAIDEADGSVSLTVTDANGCSATTSSVTVSENADPTPSITGAADYCASDASVTVSADQAYTTYSWSTGGSAMTEAIDQADGSVSLTVTDANGCSATTSSVTVSENANPVVSLSPFDPDTVDISSPAITLPEGTPIGGIHVDSNFTPISSFDPSTFGLGMHVIYYAYQDPVTTCSNADSTFIFVTTITGLTTWIGEPVSVYPNPTGGTQSITVDLGQFRNKITVELLSLKGELLYSRTYSEALEVQIPLTDTAESVYLVKVNDGNRSTVLRVTR